MKNNNSISLVKELKLNIKLIKKIHKGYSKEFSSIEEFVLKKGQFFELGNCVGGVAKQCFKNALLYSINNSLIYVEGYILVYHFPILHAWVLDKENKVIEVTLKELSSEYYGVKFNSDYIFHIAEKRSISGVLDCPDINFPLLTKKHEYLDYNNIKY